MNLLKILTRPIAFQPIFARITGSATAGLFLSQLYYWHDKGKDPEGWIYKSYEEWHSETCLSRSEIDRARRDLRELGILSEAKRGMPRRLFYKLDTETLEALILSSLQNPADKLAESSKQECRIPQAILYTETTSEITAASADDEKPVDPFFTGQYRAIARELVKQQKLSAAPRNFLEDGPWAELAIETQRTNAMVFRHFKTYLEEIANVQGKRDPEAYAGAIANSLFNNPGSELACKPWIKFADHYRVHLCVPDVSPLEDSALGQNYSRFKNALDQFED
jgi:hypothetical protein